MIVAVTGANGFVGRALCSQLATASVEVRRLVRNQTAPEEIGVGDLALSTDIETALADVTTVVHLAARAHVMREGPGEVMNRYRQANVVATRRLAEAACAAGARRFVFLSSVKVHGERTSRHCAFRPEDAFNPNDDYALSKVEAERVLDEFAADLDVVTLRPPLIYGPGVRANFQLLVDAVRRGVPLPLASISNERSLLGLTNLCSAIETVITHPDRIASAFMLSDGAAISTPDLVRAIAEALGKTAALMPFPVPLLRLVGGLTGRRATVDRLCDSLVVDDMGLRAAIGWRPPCDLRQGLRDMLGPR